METKLHTDRAKKKFAGDFDISTLQHELWHCPRMTVVMLVHKRMRHVPHTCENSAVSSGGDDMGRNERSVEVHWWGSSELNTYSCKTGSPCDKGRPSSGGQRSLRPPAHTPAHRPQWKAINRQGMRETQWDEPKYEKREKRKQGGYSRSASSKMATWGRGGHQTIKNKGLIGFSQTHGHGTMGQPACFMEFEPVWILKTSSPVPQKLTLRIFY